MPSPEEAAERAVFDDGSSIDDDESDDTESDASESDRRAPSAAGEQAAAAGTSPSPAAANPGGAAAGGQPENGGGAMVVAVAGRDPLVYEGTPRLFQKLWTDEDELVILQGFYEFTSQRGTTHADYQYDTGPFYDQIKARLQLDFTKNQLIEKLRRLKKKYRTAVSRISQGRTAVFKSPHDKATFDISRKIWSPVFKRSRPDHPNLPTPRSSARRRRRSFHARPDPPPPPPSSSSLAITPVPVQIEGPPALTPSAPQAPQAAAATATASLAPAPTTVEETVRSCLSPLFKELIQSAAGGGGGAAAGLVMPLGVGGGGAAADEKWRRQQILELEVYAKRLELVQEEIKAKLHELRSAGS